MVLKKNSTCPLKSTTHAFPDVTIRTNSLGMRNPEVQIPKPAGTFRILMIGDSYVTGWGVEEEQSLPRLLEQKLQSDFPGKHIEVINAGLPGSGPNYYYLFMKYIGMKLQPDLVIVGFLMLNDIVDNVSHTTWLTVDEHGLPLTVSHSLSRIDDTGNIIPSSIPDKFTTPFLKYSHLYALIYDSIHPPKDENTSQTENPINEHTCLYKESCHMLDDAKERTKKLFLGIKNIATEIGATILIAQFPSQLQIEKKARLKYGILIPLLPADKDRPYKEFGVFFESNGISHLDMRSQFAGYPVTETYFAEDDHWTPKGHEVAASGIREKLHEFIQTH